VGNAAGNLVTSWLNPGLVLIGILAVPFSGYLAAVYLAADALRYREPTAAAGFRRRALAAGLVSGALALAGLLVKRGSGLGLTHGTALPPVIASGVAGLVTLMLCWRSRFGPARRRSLPAARHDQAVLPARASSPEQAAPPPRPAHPPRTMRPLERGRYRGAGGGRGTPRLRQSSVGPRDRRGLPCPVRRIRLRARRTLTQPAPATSERARRRCEFPAGRPVRPGQLTCHRSPLLVSPTELFHGPTRTPGTDSRSGLLRERRPG
jgi:hypothetical protein